MDQLSTDSMKNSERACVQVFAKISAAISHEIRNTLAIINENAGLLADYCQMPEYSDGVPVQQLCSLTTAIERQVERSQLIMKNLSRFAHSADNRLGQSKLDETLTLVLALIERQAAMKNITFSLDCPDHISIHTDLICLESLVYLTLLSLFESCEEGSVLKIGVREEQGRFAVTFTTEMMDEQFLTSYPDEDQKILVSQLGGAWQLGVKILGLSFPADFTKI